MDVVRDGDRWGEGLILSGGNFQSDSPDNAFWGFSNSSGTVAKFDGEQLDGKSLAAINTRGCPTGVAVQDGRVYVSDVEHGAILKVDETTNKVVPIVRDYEGAPLLGPSSITLGRDGTLYFTDSGALGESSLDNCCGSVFVITRDENGQILRPLALKCLAHPCGVCVSPIDDSTLYVAETLKNRILRFTKRPHGAYICSVLHQFSGRLGPSAIACNNDGRLFVACFDFGGNGALISIIDPAGTAGGHVRDIEIPEIGSEVTGLTIHDSELYVFESFSSKAVKIKI